MTPEVKRLVHNGVIDGKIAGVRGYQKIIQEALADLDGAISVQKVAEALETAADLYELSLQRQKK